MTVLALWGSQFQITDTYPTAGLATYTSPGTFSDGVAKDRFAVLLLSSVFPSCFLLEEKWLYVES